MSSSNKEYFSASFSILKPFFFLFLSYFTITSSTVLNRSSERGHSCLVLSGKTFNFSPLVMMAVVGLLYQ